MNPGDSFLLETNKGKDGQIQRHLFVLIVEPHEVTKETIIVPVDTIRTSQFDRTTILEIGCHEFIKKRSFVNYRLSRLETTEFIEEMVRQGRGKGMDPFSAEEFLKISGGVLRSGFSSYEVRDHYQGYLYRKIQKK